MTRVDAQLYVALKGADLAAATAEMALVDKMGFGDRLIGLRRFDYFRFTIDTPAPPSTTVDILQRILDSQSTFYNRNKHLYSLSCVWDDESRILGQPREDVQRRWEAETLQRYEAKQVRDLDGKKSPKEGILNNSGRFLVEVLVEDDDTQARTSVAARIAGGLGANGETRGAEVSCANRATIWWLAIYAPTAEAAKETARDITVTTRRDRGLLANPNYQRVEVVSVQPMAAKTR
jgi:hypothetical protein